MDPRSKRLIGALYLRPTSSRALRAVRAQLLATGERRLLARVLRWCADQTIDDKNASSVLSEAALLLHVEEQDSEEVIGYLREAVRRDPMNEDASLLLEGCWRERSELGLLEQMLMGLLDDLRHGGGSVVQICDVATRLGRVHLALGAPERAIEVLQSERDPDESTPELDLALADAHEAHSGRSGLSASEATEALERAAELRAHVDTLGDGVITGVMGEDFEDQQDFGAFLRHLLGQAEAKGEVEEEDVTEIGEIPADLFFGARRSRPIIEEVLQASGPSAGAFPQLGEAGAAKEIEAVLSESPDEAVFAASQSSFPSRASSRGDSLPPVSTGTRSRPQHDADAGPADSPPEASPAKPEARAREGGMPERPTRPWQRLGTLAGIAGLARRAPEDASQVRDRSGSVSVGFGKRATGGIAQAMKLVQRLESAAFVPEDWDLAFEIMRHDWREVLTVETIEQPTLHWRSESPRLRVLRVLRRALIQMDPGVSGSLQRAGDAGRSIETSRVVWLRPGDTLDVKHGEQQLRFGFVSLDPPSERRTVFRWMAGAALALVALVGLTLAVVLDWRDEPKAERRHEGLAAEVSPPRVSSPVVVTPLTEPLLPRSPASRPVGSGSHKPSERGPDVAQASGAAPDSKAQAVRGNPSAPVAPDAAPEPTPAKQAGRSRQGDTVDRLAHVAILVPKSRVFGRLGRYAVATPLIRVRPRLERCYRAALQLQPELRGQLTLQWQISRRGSPGGVRNRSSDPGLSGMAECVGKVIQRLRFPRPRGGPATARFVLKLSRG